jgi:hypothetical protein
MIHQVGIKSLPPEWLWCETWCSDSEKTRAKTIDLVRWLIDSTLLLLCMMSILVDVSMEEILAVGCGCTAI